MNNDYKQQQMQDYYIAVKSIIKKLSTKRTLYLYDCGCGRSYLSFYLNHCLQNDGFNNVAFIGIDHNKDLIERCRQTAAAMKMDNMEFYESSIIDFNFPYPPDIVYSLHACDTATDQMIYKGIAGNAKYILSVSCCQHTTRRQMKRHPLSMVTRHKPYKERLADMVSDSLRALILEAHGYKVSVYEFVAAANTPKNIMLKCEKVQKTNDKANLVMHEYDKLAGLFCMYPVLQEYFRVKGMEEHHMFNELTALLQRPKLYEKGTHSQTEIWTDEHVSKGMLEAHLNPNWDAATRPYKYVQETVKWIGATAPPNKYPVLLDLGCGPGIYAELFHQAGYRVTGMDFSQRSIEYARNSAKGKNLPIQYHFQDYLTLNFTAQFDIVTLIYYDFGVLSPQDRTILLEKIFTALKPGGLFTFDVYTPRHLAGREENSTWQYASEGGFFSPQPHLCLNSFMLYNDKRVLCDRHVIITQQGIRSFNIWEHTFTKDELQQELTAAGLSLKGLYGNMTGAVYNENSKEMCVVAEKSPILPHKKRRAN